MASKSAEHELGNALHVALSSIEVLELHVADGAAKELVAIALKEMERACELFDEVRRERLRIEATLAQPIGEDNPK